MSRHQFSTRWFDYSFDSGGRLIEFKEKATGLNLARPDSYAFYLLTGTQNGPEEKKELPEEVRVFGSKVSVYFSEVSFELQVISYPDYLHFTILTQKPAEIDYGRFVFAAAQLMDNSQNSFCGSAISLDIRCNLLELPGRSSQLGAVAYAKLGATDLCAAITGIVFADLRDAIRNSLAHVSACDLPLTSMGGPYGASARGVYDDYMLIDIKPDISNDDWLKPVFKSGVKQVHFHQGFLYRQADYRFDPQFFPNGAPDFKRLVADRLAEKGLASGLHTYSGMVSVKSSFVSPQPDPGLHSFAEYTLAEDIDEQAGSIRLKEDVAKVPLFQTPHNLQDATCLLAGQEIISFGGRAAGNILTGCQRGHLNTNPQKHKKGDKLRHIRSMYNFFQSRPGSSLFYRLARNMASTYNQGGFSYLFFDGLECIGACCTGDLLGLGWYYEALFVRETLRYCHKPPLVGYSTMHPLLWAARSRVNAYDYPTSAYKRYIDLHCSDNELHGHMKLLPSELGWIHLYPTAADYAQPADNWTAKYSYSDDIDYIGTKSIAYDSVLSYIYPSNELLEKFPVLAQYFTRISPYARLRSERYFSASLREKLKKPNEGWHLIKEAGKYGFQRLTRLQDQPFLLNEPANVKLDNPFHAQKPSLRLEAQSSAEQTPGKLLWQVNQEISSGQPLTREFAKPLDLTGHEAVTISIKSEGRPGKLRVRLTSQPPYAHAFADHLLDLSFTGTRTFHLCEHDNGEGDDLEWQGEVADGYHTHTRYRNPVTYKAINSIRLLHSGEASVYVKELRAHPVAKSPVINPSVSIGQDEIKFLGKLYPGQYLEYSPEEEAASLYNAFGMLKKIPVQGRLGLLPQGQSVLGLGGDAQGNRRLKLHLLVYGEKLFDESGG